MRRKRGFQWAWSTDIAFYLDVTRDLTNETKKIQTFEVHEKMC